ncbi:FAD/FMN-containing isoamyl alcohol oxidase-like protein MreA [Polyplosphaeria fusca]|uniref:FAD/FMN-containing isoamyl alcohol oxidase-like protein MreA n=1 Tax=Polyplosphaeria fusca TaxID=682080 RepID=A0A9P4R7G2_9PLEO|nr:FAD/FMN-containing isoamyl alcohol oxidase-like protein MreA [Polyplosphaeria fusca]
MVLFQSSFFTLAVVQSAFALNFPFESIQLAQSDVGNNSDIRFGTLPVDIAAKCKSFPGDAQWPSAARWEAFNSSLNGALIKGIPPAASCYSGPYYNAERCSATTRGQRSSLWTMEDPIIPNMQWQLGNPCPVPRANITPPIEDCKIASFPAYAVNATNAKHVQLAVNFARNNNIRLVIKNTGHDFLGRNTGGGSLMVWVHHFKGFEYLPSYRLSKYEGKAARVGAALMQFELHQYMEKYNITLLAPGSSTVGAYGGFMQGGGFSTILTSKLGLMADQVLGLEVVTADGKFVHADPHENTDLFWAVRGGGPSNFGIVTSAIVKAYDVLPISVVELTLQTNRVTTNTSTAIQVSESSFWQGISIYFANLASWQDAKCVGWNTINAFGSFNSTSRAFSFRGQVNCPGLTSAQAKSLVAPMYSTLSKAGINLTAGLEPKYFESFPKQAFRPQGPGEGAGGGRFGSRLIPRENFEDPESLKFNKTMAAIRSFVEDGGYPFHSVDYTPTYEIAGWPGRESAVNPHLREAAMHFTGQDFASYGPETTHAQQIASHSRLNTYVQKIRDASPGSGAYMNEADTEEPDFKESFFGDNYDALYDIKKKRDPWGLFYAVTMVSSDEWYVEDTDGLPTQQGRLCRK